MLPDYPRVKQKAGALLLRRLQEEVDRRSPVLSELRRALQHEGDKAVQGDVEGRSSEIEYKRLEAGMTIRRSEMRCGQFSEVLDKIGEMAETMAKEQTTLVLTGVADAAESVGNVVRGAGRPAKEVFLEMLEQVQTDFDPISGEPRLPTLVMHPDAIAEFKDDVDEWGQDPEFREAVAEIKERQREAWRVRESRRRLVD